MTTQFLELTEKAQALTCNFAPPTASESMQIEIGRTCAELLIDHVRQRRAKQNFLFAAICLLGTTDPLLLRGFLREIEECIQELAS